MGRRRGAVPGGSGSQGTSGGKPSWRRQWVRGRRLPFDPWKWALAVLLACAAVVVIGWVLLGSRLLVVRTIQVAGEQLVSRTQIVEAAKVRLGAPLIRVHPAAVERRVEEIRQVESARAERRWPSTLRIVVTERTPVAATRTASGYRLLDRFGVTVTKVARRPEGMPLIDLADPDPTDQSTRAALAVVQALPAELENKVSKVSAEHPREVTLRLEGGAKVVWGGPQRSAKKARILMVLLKRDAEVYDVSTPEVATTR